MDQLGVSMGLSICRSNLCYSCPPTTPTQTVIKPQQGVGSKLCIYP